ncbi:hypothetical protein [Agrobacterium tumefaciens]|uniref:hypothetical protein n=1 Tax=Agrobacterium tumefaciens TaxID=358 RepID=UPI0011783B0E|nr:hypothetical protein [Agrobacterium tumefaciens]NIB54919.1 hypothetical protein [Agrobacterium tumefaciens]NSZ21636.1 hypothetical protein [Agrobacterium tumefaciens]QQE32531.1 hypothetical protein I6I05_11290 [Agrobacterium tumefaciens]
MAVLTIIGVIGGINADIPEVGEDPALKSAMSFFSRVLVTILWFLTHYPDGVVIGILVTAGICYFLFEPQAAQNEAQYNKKRAAIAPRPRRKRKRK